MKAIAPLLLVLVAVSPVLAAEPETLPPGAHLPKITCAPAVLPEDIASWPMVGHRVGVAKKTESGEPEEILLVDVQRGSRTITLAWAAGELAVVDMAPDDPAVPVWVNRRVITDAGLLRHEGVGDCRWTTEGPGPRSTS